jgi:hypothetical protein
VLVRRTILLGTALLFSGCKTMPEKPTPQLKAVMSGAQEVPGPGDKDGSGSFTATLKPSANELCYNLEVGNIDPATAAHIHRGAAGVAGPPVIPLEPPTHGESGTCVAVDAALAAELTQSPAGFYVNVHNAAFPAGAVRGQLTAVETSNETSNRARNRE